MNILVISSGYPPDVKGGGEHSTKIISEGLVKLGHQVNVLTLSDHEVQEEINGVNVQREFSPNLYWNFKKQNSKLKKIIWHALDNFNPRAYSLVKNYIKKLNPDIVLTSTIENFGAEAWKASHATGKPVVHVLRSYYVMCYRGTCFKAEQNCTTICNDCNILSVGRRAEAKNVDGLIGISQFILEKHRPLFKNAIKQVIYNPVNTVDALPKQIIGDEINFGYLGRLEPEKGIELLLKAFIKFPSNCQLFIGGTGDDNYTAFLKRTYGQANIHFLGWTNAQEVYKKIHYLVLPAQWHEPFGRVVVEAFAYGVPVIGAMRGGIPELIKEGNNGYLFEPTLPDSLDRAFLLAIKNAHFYHIMSSNAIISSKQFNQKEISKKYENFLKEVLDKKVVSD